MRAAAPTRVRPNHALATLACGTALLLQACISVGPDYEEPRIDTPDIWHQNLMRGLTEGKADLTTWWTNLEDPLLNTLIDRSTTGNLDLQEAIGRIRESVGDLGIARGERFPDLDGTGAAQRTRVSRDIQREVPEPGSRTDNFLSLGVDSSWELDLWGRITRSVESSDASLQASIEDYRDVLVILYSEVASSYVDVRTFQARIRFAERNVETQRGSLELTVDRNRAGLVGDLDVRQAEQNLASTESAIPRLRQGLAESIHRIGVLLGLEPQALYAQLETPGEIPVPPKEIVIGLPTELMRQRPAIRRAERDLAGQTAQIGVATADRIPRFSLIGTFAFEGLRGGDFLDWTNRAFVLGPTLQWNLFDGGRVRNNIRVQDALTEQLLRRYENTVLLALEDVENSLVAYVQESDRRDALQRSVVASRQAVELVSTLYRTGLTDFQNVLDTERTLFVTRPSLSARASSWTKRVRSVSRTFWKSVSPVR